MTFLKEPLISYSYWAKITKYQHFAGAELQCKLNSQPCTGSYVKVRALIRKKSDSAIGKGTSGQIPMGQAGDLKILNSTKSLLPFLFFLSLLLSECL